MTTEEKMEVFAAEQSGKPVYYRAKGSNVAWCEKLKELWDFNNFEYRTERRRYYIDLDTNHAYRAGEVLPYGVNTRNLIAVKEL